MDEIQYIFFIVDGAADHPLACFGGLTALQAARHPAMDRMVRGGVTGTSQTIREGFLAGTDAAILALFGYQGDTGWGRGVLEAVGYDEDITGYSNVMRCNLVSMTPEHILLSHNGFGISDAAGRQLALDLQQDTGIQAYLSALHAKLLPGAGFRHLIATKDAWRGFGGPHDVLNTPIPAAPAQWSELIKRAEYLLSHHPLQQQLTHPVNGIWPWGGGTIPMLPSFPQRFGKSGCCITAVPVVKGIAKLAGLHNADVPGANGRLDTDWRAKVQAVLESEYPFALLHLEAPDECSHEKNPHEKVAAIELADSMLQTLMQALDARKQHYRILLMADHYTSAFSGKHSAEPVPFVLFDSRTDHRTCDQCYSEPSAASTGISMDADALLPLLMNG